MKKLDLQVIIPIYHPDDKFIMLLKMLKQQTVGKVDILIIDSGSDKKWLKYIDGLNIRIKDIESKDFNHGGTRQMGVEMCKDKDIFIFMTQDAILVDESSIERLAEIFNNKKIGCAYGRQIPHKDADLFSQYIRNFNYPEKSYIRSYEEKDKFGMKTPFLSNSFAAYKKEAMMDIGGFPTNTILGEDMYVAAKMLKRKWKVAYVADACVYHSHNYTIAQEFKRYFDIGVFHSRERWIREEFGKAESEGRKFIIGEIKYLGKNRPSWLLKMIIRDGMKLLGYRLGINEFIIPRKFKVIMSMTKKYWMVQ